jgi:transposase InsO family protein
MLDMLLTLASTLCSALNTHHDLVLENLALRHQVAVLIQSDRRPRFRPWDRLLWIGLRRLWGNWRQALVLVQPATVVRWHRQCFRRYWRRKSRRLAGRPRINTDARALVRRMATANPLWGAPRIHGELLKLGIEVSERTVSRYLPKRSGPPSQSWRAFLTNHLGDLVSIDFFTVPTLRCQILFCFLVLSHDRRRVLHVNVTRHPTAAWTARQIIEAFPWNTAPRYLLRDRDAVYSSEFRRRVGGLGIEQMLSAAQSPWQSPYVERLIGSIRRECLDHIIVRSERLTLLKSSLRHDNTLLAGKYGRDTSITDPRFQDSVGPVQTIATSNGQADSGLFELNFHDERYLPFEMAGAISSWHLELSPLAQFDYATITDVVLQVRYTARETAVLKAKASSELAAALNTIALADGRKGPAALFSLKHRFTSEWVRFVGATAPGVDHIQTFRLGSDLFPFYLRGRKIKIARIQLLALSSDAVMAPFDIFVTPAGAVPDATKDKISFVPNPIYGGALHGVKAWLAGQEKEPGTWTVRIGAADFAALSGALKDIQFSAEYTAA